MASIQLRLSQDQFQKRISEFLGKNINVVLHDHTTSFGNVEKIGLNNLTLRNMRLGLKIHLLSDINEVYFDKNS
jgi:hypothetical protein